MEVELKQTLSTSGSLDFPKSSRMSTPSVKLIRFNEELGFSLKEEEHITLLDECIRVGEPTIVDEPTKPSVLDPTF